ncbi:hypothetical protein MD484_g8338, partial [Candolleomyces efflorescens]
MSSRYQSTSTIPEAPPGLPSSGSSRLMVMYDRLKDEIEQLVKNDNESQGLIENLKKELSKSNRAYSSLEAELSSLNAEKCDVEKQRDELQSQLKSTRLIVLIDGDGAIFDPELIAEGKEGGQRAASKLSDGIIQSLPGRNNHHLWVYVFLNKKGLSDTLGRVSKFTAKLRLDDFIIGFNHASERFIMADVGYAKEGADAKIRAILESEIRLPQTDSIIFGGCHDNGYVPALRSHITSGFRNKIILLQGYNEVAAGISGLNLPTITIPGLFLPEKIQTGAGSPQASHVDLPTGTSLQTPPPTSSPSLTPSTWSAVVKSRPRGTSHARSDTNNHENSADLGSIQARRNPGSQKKREVDRSLTVWNQNPPACTLYYLSPTKCKLGNDCRYAHDYDFTDAEIDDLGANAKKVPCTTIIKGETCLWGDECIWGHKCGFLTRCHYAKEGKCRFSGRGMHTPDEEKN